MRKLLVLLAVAAAAVALTMVTAGGTAFAGKVPEEGNTGKPSNPPCDADHGHPGSNVGKCQDGNGQPPPPPPPAADCTATEHEDAEFGDLTGGLHDMLVHRFPEPIAGTGHHALCAVAFLTGGAL